MKSLFGAFVRIGTSMPTRNSLLSTLSLISLLGCAACSPIQWDSSSQGGFDYWQPPVSEAAQAENVVAATDTDGMTMPVDQHSTNTTSSADASDKAVIKAESNSQQAVAVVEAPTNADALASKQDKVSIEQDTIFTEQDTEPTKQNISPAVSSIREELTRVAAIAKAGVVKSQASGSATEAETASEPKTAPAAALDVQKLDGQKDEQQKVSKVDLANSVAAADKASVSGQQQTQMIAQINELEPTAAGISAPINIANDANLGEEPQMQKAGLDDALLSVKSVTSDESHYRIKLQNPQPKNRSLAKLNWTLDQRANGRSVCLLRSPTMQFDSQDYTAQVWFYIEEDRLIVNSTTNLDANMSKVGLQLDAGPLLAFNSASDARHLIWGGDLASVIDQHKALRVYLGGDELGSQIKEAYISLSGLKQTFARYQNCRAKQMRQARN